MTLNILAVALAGVAGMAVGAVWFSPVLFGKPWRRLAGVDPAAKQAWWVYALAFVATLVTSAVVALGAGVVHDAVGGSYLGVALAVASIGWLGLTLSRNAVEYLFGEQARSAIRDRLRAPTRGRHGHVPRHRPAGPLTHLTHSAHPTEGERTCST